MSRRFKLAAAQYPIEWLDGWQAYAAKVTGWVERAVEDGARLLVFPEYGSMELASLFPDPTPGDLVGQLGAVASLEPQLLELHDGLARRHGLHLLMPSLPVEVAPGRFHNRAWFLGPDGTRDFQDKIVMTRFEREQWGVTGSDELKLFDTALGRIGVCICYDVEFPLLARAQVEAGAELILAPSCTETLRGYWRVRVGAQARALENQCIVVQSPTVGEAPWSPAVDLNRGAAGVYGPPDLGFPDDGILAAGRLDAPEWLVAEIDLDRVAEVRAQGAVLNHRHWPEQAAVVPRGVTRVSL
jgi:predicted amidohydrolase